MAPPRTRSRRLLLALGAVLLALGISASPAAANVITPESPHSPNADDINSLYWVGLVVMGGLIAIVVGALLFAVVRFRDQRGAEPRQIRGGRRIQVRATAALALFATGLFVVSVIFTEKAREVAPSGPDGLEASSATFAQRSLQPPPGDAVPLQIDATAQQWLWRFDYPDGAFSYYELVVPVDTAVRLDLLSTDVVHGWYVPELGGKFEAVPGKQNHAWFRADETGTYEGRASTFSGAAYPAERMKVRVVTPVEYEAFLDQQTQDIQAAQDAVAAEVAAGAES